MTLPEENVPSNPQPIIMTLYRTEAILEQKQPQIRVDGIGHLLKDAGIHTNLISAKKYKFVEIICRTIAGDIVTLRMGDTHAMWLQHQNTTKSIELFKKILDLTSNGGLVEIEVLEVKYRVGFTGNRPSSGKVIKL